MGAATIGLLRSNGFIAKGLPSADEFLNSNRIRISSCLIADVQMPKMGGPALCGNLVVSGTPIPTILITAYPDDAHSRARHQAGVTAYLVKPFSEKELLACIDAAAKHNTPLVPSKP